MGKDNGHFLTKTGKGPNENTRTVPSGRIFAGESLMEAFQIQDEGPLSALHNVVHPEGLDLAFDCLSDERRERALKISLHARDGIRNREVEHIAETFAHRSFEA